MINLNGLYLKLRCFLVLIVIVTFEQSFTTQTSMASSGYSYQQSSQSVTNIALKLWKGGMGFVGNMITINNHLPLHDINPGAQYTLYFSGSAKDTINSTLVFNYTNDTTYSNYHSQIEHYPFHENALIFVTSRGKTFSGTVDELHSQVEVIINKQLTVQSQSTHEQIGHFQSAYSYSFPLHLPIRAYLKSDGSVFTLEGHKIGFISDLEGVPFLLVTNPRGSILTIKDISNVVIISGSSEMDDYWKQKGKEKADKVNIISISSGFSLILPSEVKYNPFNYQNNLKVQDVLMYLPDSSLSSGIYTAPYDKKNLSKEMVNKENCHEEQLNPTMLAKGGVLASEVASNIRKIEEQAKKMNSQINVLLLARSGTNPGSSQVLKDYHQGKYLSLKNIRGPLTDESSFGTVYNYIGQFADHNRKLDYSHVAIAFRQHPRSIQIQREKNLPEPPWTLVHLLKPCYSAKPELFEEGLWSFFLDDLYQYKAQIIVPSPQLQDKLEELVIKKKQGSQFLGKKYNALSLYDDQEEQNSNQWVLEVIAASLKSNFVKDRLSAQETLKEFHYHPTRLLLSGKALFAKHLNLDSLSLSKQKYSQDNLIEVITALSLQEFLTSQKQIMLQMPVEIDEKEMMGLKIEP